MALLTVRLAAICCLCATLGGCAAVAGAIAGQVVATAIVGGVTCAAKGEVGCAAESLGGTSAVQLDYPDGVVYRGFLSTAEVDGRNVVASDDAARSLTVSYPFSLLDNNLGGEITVRCTAEGTGTRVLFDHGHRDAASRVKKIEVKMLDEVRAWLEQPAGRAYLDAWRAEHAAQPH